MSGVRYAAPDCAGHSEARIPAAPAPSNPDWPRIDVDRLIDKLRAVRLMPADRHVLLAVPVGLVVFALTLALGWPLRHDGEMIWTALGAVL